MRAFHVGQFVHSLLWPTAVIVGVEEDGRPIVEAWGYGRALGPINPVFLIPDKPYGTVTDARHWFRVSVDAAVKLYGEDARPRSEVAQDIYIKALEDKERRSYHEEEAAAGLE